MENFRRGVLTDEFTLRMAREFFGPSFDEVKYPRLLVYLHYCLTNSGMLDYLKISFEETEILEEWCERGWIEIDENENVCLLSSEFLRAMIEIVTSAYIDKRRIVH